MKTELKQLSAKLMKLSAKPNKGDIYGTWKITSCDHGMRRISHGRHYQMVLVESTDTTDLGYWVNASWPI